MLLRAASILVILVSLRPADREARVAMIIANAPVIATTDHAAEDMSDLEPLREILRDVRVVSLGEPTHGDGAAFEMKVRLIRFLHEQMGFEVLAWESGLAECEVAQSAMVDGRSAAEALEDAVFPIWTRSAQVQPLFAMMDRWREQGRPLTTTGFDCQLSGGESTAARIMSLIDPALVVADRGQLASGLASFSSLDERGLRELREIASALAERPTDARTAHILRNIGDFSLMRAAALSARPGCDERAAVIRERAMARTLIWLASERWPQRRIIVWAASSHMTFRSRGIEFRESDGSWRWDTDVWEPMGNAVRAALGPALYTICPIAYEGSWATAFRSEPITLAPAPTDSFDDLCHASGRSALLLDLRGLSRTEEGAWLRERLVARPRGYAPMRACWPESCDAFLFIDRMTPSARAP